MTETATAREWRKVERGPLAGFEFPVEGEPWFTRLIIGEYERAGLAEIVRLAEKGIVLFDVGAHIGVYSAAWLKHGGAVARAFEPCPSNAALILEMAERNGLGITVHRAAVGAENGLAELVESTESLGYSSMCHLHGFGAGELRGVRGREVPVTTLDEYMIRGSMPPPDVIKIDVEDAEVEVIRGAMELLKEVAPTLLIELHSPNSGVQVGYALGQLRYRCKLLELRGNTAQILAYPK